MRSDGGTWWAGSLHVSFQDSTPAPQATLCDSPRHRSNLLGVTFDAQNVMPAPVGQPTAEREPAGRSVHSGNDPRKCGSTRTRRA